MNSTFSVADLSDAELISEVKARAAHERGAMAALVASLAELDARRLYLGEGYSSLFTYCTQALHLSEHAAYGRIEAARAARRFPVIVDMLADGAVTLTTVCLIAPILTSDKHEEILGAVRHKTKREVEHLVAALRPRPPIPPVVRKLRARKCAEIVHAASDTAAAGPAGVLSAPVVVPQVRRPAVAPLAPEQYKVQFTIGAETHERLCRAQDLLRHVIPNGDPAQIFDRALTLLVSELEKKKLGAARRPRETGETLARSRHVPAAVKREVWKRDDGRCAFIGRNGRCAERGFLEFHHVVPYADGGATTADNLQLRCRAHNAYESERHFGSLWVRECADALWWTRPGPVRTELSSTEREGDARAGPAPQCVWEAQCPPNVPPFSVGRERERSDRRPCPTATAGEASSHGRRLGVQTFNDALGLAACLAANDDLSTRRHIRDEERFFIGLLPDSQMTPDDSLEENGTASQRRRSSMASAR